MALLQVPHLTAEELDVGSADSDASDVDDEVTRTGSAVCDFLGLSPAGTGEDEGAHVSEARSRIGAACTGHRCRARPRRRGPATRADRSPGPHRAGFRCRSDRQGPRPTTHAPDPCTPPARNLTTDTKRPAGREDDRHRLPYPSRRRYDHSPCTTGRLQRIRTTARQGLPTCPSHRDATRRTDGLLTRAGTPLRLKSTSHESKVPSDRRLTGRTKCAATHQYHE